MGDLCQRVGLVHELAQWVGTEERVDDAGNSLCVDQVCRRELLTDRTYTTVAQVVDIVNSSIGVDELDQIFNDLDDVFLREHTHIRLYIEIQFLVDTITADIPQVVTLVREEQILEHFTCTCIICRFSITQLFVNIAHCLNLRVTLIFLQSLEDDIVLRGSIVVLMHKNGRDATVNDRIKVVFGDLCLTLEHHFVTLGGNNLTGILINEVFSPCSQHTGSKLTSNKL